MNDEIKTNYEYNNVFIFKKIGERKYINLKERTDTINNIWNINCNCEYVIGIMKMNMKIISGSFDDIIDLTTDVNSNDELYDYIYQCVRKEPRFATYISILCSHNIYGRYNIITFNRVFTEYIFKYYNKRKNKYTSDYILSKPLKKAG